MDRSRRKARNPVTGEVMVFHRTSAQTDGEEVFVELRAKR
jgi:hypothetical protein